MSMNVDGIVSIVCRIFFAGAFGLLALAAFERLSFAFGYTLLRGTLTGGRLLEISAVILIFVIALLLRQIREKLENTAAG
jgi:hypothetical protein